MHTPFNSVLNILARGLLVVTVVGGIAVWAYASEKLALRASLAQVNSAVAAPKTVAIDGASMAHTCAACHGTLGRLGDETFMPLAGMPERQFVATMRDFREGKRPATLMGHVAQGFNDSEIQAMARFFAAVPPEVKQP